MATLRVLAGAAVVASVAIGGCSKPLGLDGAATPLTQIHVLVTGSAAEPTTVDAGDTLDAGDTIDAEGTFDGGTLPPLALPAQLRAALVWGLQWLPEPFCVLPAESSDVAAVIEAGCRDSFGFVPDRVAADTLITPGVPAILNLYTLPSADVMVGDVTARVAYASLIVYDDRNGNGALDIRHPQRQRRRGDAASDAGGAADIVYGASFVSMTLPDRRVAFREGDFNESVAFYPRAGCPDPPKLFSILSASGFNRTAALLSLVTGQLPLETDLNACTITSINDTIVVPLQDPAQLSQLTYTTNDSDDVTYYRPVPTDPPFDLTKRIWACASFPRLGSEAPVTSAGKQLVVASSSADPCLSTMHYTLRGCDNDPFCTTPSWDFTDNPPTWWPCATTP